MYVIIRRVSETLTEPHEKTILLRRARVPYYNKDLHTYTIILETVANLCIISGTQFFLNFFFFLRISWDKIENRYQ